MTNLNNLSSAIKVEISEFPKTGVFFRLREMGLTEKTTVIKLRQAPFNGPVEIGFLNTKIMLRKNDAEKIKVEIK